MLLVRGELADGREHAKGIGAQEHDVLWLPGLDSSTRLSMNSLSSRGVLGQAVVVKIGTPFSSKITFPGDCPARRVVAKSQAPPRRRA